MMTTEQIGRYFKSLSEFEQFRLEWMRCCAAINKNSDNAILLARAEERAEYCGIAI